MIVTSEQFVTAWLASSSFKEVCEKTGMEAAAVYARSRKLRKVGVNLPRFPRLKPGPKGLDVAALNALIKSKSKSKAVR